MRLHLSAICIVLCKTVCIVVFFAAVAELPAQTASPPAKPQTEQSEALDVTWENIFTRKRGASQAAISPDGKQVAVVARTARQAGIFLVSVDGSQQPKFWIRGSSPVWTSDGKQIIYSRGGDFWKVELGSSEPTPITEERQEDGRPDCHPTIRCWPITVDDPAHRISGSCPLMVRPNHAS